MADHTDSNLSAQVTPFLIFATQRTGSNWLMGMLDAHPAVAAYDELFLAEASRTSYWGRADQEAFDSYYARRRKRDNRFARSYWSFRYLSKLYACRPDTEAIGMKLMYEQLWKNPWLWIYIIRHRVRIIHLVRSNLLDVVISIETAKARKQFHALENEAVQTSTVTLNPKNVIATLKTLQFRVKMAHWLLILLPVTYLEISYEQLLFNPALLDDVFAFLDVPPYPEQSTPPSKFKRLNNSRKPDTIRNYSEVERALKGTRFAHFLDS